MRHIADIANQTMPPAQHTDRVIHQDGNTGDIVSVILEADRYNGEQTKELAPHLKGKTTRETLRNVWFFVRNYIEYRKDTPGHERIKLPAKTWADRYGDCKSMSVFIAGLLKNLGIPAKYRFVSYRRGGPVTHVYVVATPKGSRPVILDAVHSKFDDEEPYITKKEYPVMTKISMVHGLPGRTSINRPARIPQASFVPFSRLTEGEARMALMDRQLQILSLTDPVNAGQYNQARGIVNSVLDADLHSVSPAQLNGVGQGRYVSKVTQLVADATRLTQPAMIPQAPKISGPLDFIEKMKANAQGPPPGETYEQAYQRLLNRYQDCKRGVYKKNWAKSGTVKDAIVRQQCAEEIRARELLEYEKAINDRFEAGGYGIMYLFSPAADGNKFGNLAAKRQRYIEIRSGLHALTGISKDNLTTMAANGILAAGPQLKPEEAYVGWRDSALAGIGEPLTIAAITGIIIAIGGAAKALAALFGKVSPEDKVAYALPQTFDDTLAPNQDDFEGGAPTATAPSAASMNWILPVLLGGGLLLGGAKAFKN